MELDQLPDNLPDSVRKQHAEAEKLKAQIAERGTQSPQDAAESAAAPPPAAAEATTEAPKAVVEHAPPAISPSPAAKPAPAPSSPAPSTATAAPQGVQPTAQPDLQAENARLKHQLASIHGRHGARISQINAEMEQLRQELAEAKTASPAPAAAPAAASAAEAPAPSGGPACLQYITDDEKERYGADFVDMVSRIVRGEAESLSPKTDPEALKAAKEASVRIRAMEAKLANDRFWSAAEMMSPGIMATNGDPDAGVTAADGWSEYLDEPVSQGSLTTRREEAQRAVDSNRPDVLANMHNAFLAQNTEQANNLPPPPSVEAQTVPKSVPGAPPPPVDPGKRIIPQSEIDEFKARASKPDGGITYEEIEKKTQEFNLAFREGRVDMTA